MVKYLLRADEEEGKIIVLEIKANSFEGAKKKFKLLTGKEGYKFKPESVIKFCH